VYTAGTGSMRYEYRFGFLVISIFLEWEEGKIFSKMLCDLE